MAKKKAKSPKLPKEILGVKLPKEIREQGGALLAKAAASPAAREIVAAGLTMAAAAATAAVAKKRTPADPSTTPPNPARPAGTTDPQAIADALGGAAEIVLGRLFGGKR
ncbi:hypothetical protein PQ455_11840 [Sphingomonas naphthae]|uniref:Uncharacterized protein n=1 Tax=Sphingomonas naphthae TaxID=1813468 RepID=A0ABY7TGZ0_9SPHN|nr:hypothetical protein [Sphingomonas naphthae]WCT72328.1 hypothetical protein PQ455_11840 [Sphingomonas naphthae]